ncbi:MAG: hypothetical protein KKC37_05410, partial [Proteobacteria bacterium]|nr:hypothetical protein [Pseudomonadota bacterium]
MPAEERSRLFAVAGPPGGVGKSVLAANLAAVLTRLGAVVTLADLDQGGAGLILGLPEPELGVFHFLYEKMPLHEAVMDTDVPGLRFLGGGGDVLGAADLNRGQKSRLMDHLKNLRGDAVVVDLGSGGAYHNLDLLAMADEALLVTTPEVTAQMKAYGFLKMCSYRVIIAALKRAGHERAAELAEEARLPENARGLDTTLKLIEVLDAEAEPGS